MPVIETMLLDFGGELGVRPQRVFNVDAAVGAGAPNKQGDVMLVQAMMKEISLLFTFEFRGVTLPDVTGRMDKDTLAAIWSLQRAWSKFLLAVDGRVDPASLGGRKLRLRAEKKTLIQMMDQYLGVAMRSKRGVSDHIDGLLALYPQLHGHVRYKTSADAAVA